MKLNDIDFNKLNNNELKILIKKYNLTDNINNLSRNDCLKLIKLFIISKMKGSKQKQKQINIKRTLSDNSINNNHVNNKTIFLNKTYSNPVTNKEIKHSNYKTYSSINEQTNNIVINKELSNKNIDYDKINIYPPVKRLIAIGDLHGDLKVTLDVLKLAGVISNDINSYNFNINNLKWIGGDTWIVQTGDQIDRCRPNNWKDDCIEDYDEVFEDEGNNILIIKIFELLNKQSIPYGGRVITLLGNHELMNIDKDYRYVSPKEFLEFVPNNEVNTKYTDDGKPYGYYHRLKAFERGGNLSKLYSQSKKSIVIVGSWLFVHGGISIDLAKKYSIKTINDVVSKWLINKSNDVEEDIFDELFRQDDDISPFWCRIYGEECNENTQETFNNVLNILNNNNKLIQPIKGIVIAHTPQFMNNMYLNSLYDNRLWRIDVGMSRAFGKHDMCGENRYRQIQILIINNDNEFDVKKKPFHNRPYNHQMNSKVVLNKPSFLN